MQPIEFLYVSKLAKKDQRTLWNSLKTAIASMTKHKFTVKMIRLDSEVGINTD